LNLTGDIEMKHLINQTRKFLRDEEGVTMIEYGLIAALIALAVVATVVTIGTNLNLLFEKVKNCLTVNGTCP
jgi:pilus assembly protein Flp/PilA